MHCLSEAPRRPKRQRENPQAKRQADRVRIGAQRSSGLGVGECANHAVDESGQCDHDVRETNRAIGLELENSSKVDTCEANPFVMSQIYLRQWRLSLAIFVLA